VARGFTALLLYLLPAWWFPPAMADIYQALYRSGFEKALLTVRLYVTA